MSKDANCGVYMIECVPNGALYVGKGENVIRRVSSHQLALARSSHEVPLLQADWDKHGADAFIFWIKFVPAKTRLCALEKSITLMMNSLEHLGGYNRALVRERSITAKIRDTERKLRRSGKFFLLPDTVEWSRINPIQTQTFCQKDKPLSAIRSRQAALRGYDMPPLVINPMHGFHPFQPRTG